MSITLFVHQVFEDVVSLSQVIGHVVLLNRPLNFYQTRNARRMPDMIDRSERCRGTQREYVCFGQGYLGGGYVSDRLRQPVFRL